MILSKANDIKLGSRQVSKVYCGSQLIWEQSGGDLPSGYKRCLYLESTGTQYIDTEYIPVIGDSLSMTASKPITETSVFFSAGTGSYQLILMFANTTTLYFKYFTSENADSYGIKYVQHDPFAFYINANATVVIDGRVISSEVSKAKANVNTKLYIFARANLETYSKIKIYSFAIDGKLNFIPCLDPDGIPCMYDTVSKKTFYNAGTGTFSYELA